MDPQSNDDAFESWLSRIVFDARGLVPVVAQDALTGEIRMVAWADREALARTHRDGEAWFWSRSRKALWRKGESSGHVLRVRRVHADCDQDCVLYQVEPDGPSCHTGARNCFHDGDDGAAAACAMPMMERLEETLAARRDAPAGNSYTRQLLDAGAPRIGAKLREEADELARALADESDARVASEAADVIYHLVVGLTWRRVPWRHVLVELARRFGTSGLAEKAARPPKV